MSDKTLNFMKEAGMYMEYSNVVKELVNGKNIGVCY